MTDVTMNRGDDNKYEPSLAIPLSLRLFRACSELLLLCMIVVGQISDKKLTVLLKHVFSKYNFEIDISQYLLQYWDVTPTSVII